MNILGIEHIGIAVKSLDESVRFYEEILGLKCYTVENVEDQMVKTAFFQIGDIKIELLEATSPESPIYTFIEKRGEGLHHMAYKVENVNDALSKIKDRGVKLIDKTAREGAEGLLIGFVNPRSTFGVLTEFCSLKTKL
jgi:methylmalonyl-CoA/ethylmalonyl-CoA epimerase